MIQRVLRALRANKNLSGWRLTQETTKSAELFYVSKRLETNRAADITELKLTVYKDFETYRGSATVPVSVGLSDNEIEKLIDEALYRASFVKDPRYELVAPDDKPLLKIASNMENRSLTDCAAIIARALFKCDNVEKGSLSASEIFIYDTTYRVVNSRGVDYTYRVYRGMLEFIPNFVGEKEEVELYRSVDFSSLDEDDIAERVREALGAARDRSRAVKLPASLKSARVLLSGPDVSYLFEYFVNQLNYSTVCQRMSDFEIEKSCQGENVTGDKISISLTPYRSICAASRPIDEDGVVLSDVELIKEGTALNYHGASRWGQYLHIARPTGLVPVIVVRSGTKSIAEMKKEPYLECVAFSGLQVNRFADYIGGEVRLGYYFDGEKRYPVTGFSIGASLKKVVAAMRLSRETSFNKYAVYPATVEIQAMNVV